MMKASIALGSNLEPRLGNLREAVRQLRDLHQANTPVLASKIYETAPVDCPPGSPSFLNAVVEVSTNLSLAEFHQSLQKIETRMGRPAERERNAPRPIDLDILYCDDLVVNSPNLTLPHPRASQRLFVLQPLADLHPELKLPGEKLNVTQLAAACARSQKISERPERLF